MHEFVNQSEPIYSYENEDRTVYDFVIPIVNDYDFFKSLDQNVEFSLNMFQVIVFSMVMFFVTVCIPNNRYSYKILKLEEQIENLETEMLEFPNVEIIRTNKDALLERLAKTQEALTEIGSVNLRSLEVYDEIT
jgi:hypothetical protein